MTDKEVIGFDRDKFFKKFSCSSTIRNKRLLLDCKELGTAKIQTTGGAEIIEGTNKGKNGDIYSLDGNLLIDFT